MFRKLQTRQAQLVNVEKLSTIEGVVKLTRNVKLKAGETLKIDGRSSHHLNDKRVNVIVEPSEENWEYTIPSYTDLKSNSKRVSVGLCNLSCRAVMLKKGMVVARLSPANVVPKMLAPKLTNDQLGQESSNSEGNTDPELV